MMLGGGGEQGQFLRVCTHKAAQGDAGDTWPYKTLILSCGVPKGASEGTIFSLRFIAGR